MGSQNIYAQFAPPLRSVQDYSNELDQRDLNKLRLEGESRKNMLAGLVAQQQQQSMADGQRSQNVIRQVYSGFDPSAEPDALYSALERTGDRAAIDLAAVKRKEAMERQDTASQIGARTSEVAARDTTTVAARVAQWRDFVGMAHSAEQAATLVQLMHADPALKDTPIAKAPLDQVLGMLQSKPFDQWKAEFALGAKDFIEKNKPTYQDQDLGGSVRTVALPGLVGAPSVVSSAAKTQTPDNAASSARMAADAAAGRALTKRGQDMTDARSRDANTNAVVTGKPPQGYRFTPEGNLEAIPGGPADIKAGELGARREKSKLAAIDQADRIIATVDSALSKVGYSTSGVGSLTAALPGTPGRDLRTELETVKANLGFAELQAMRDASPTGGALGAIAVQELTALQSTIASLDQAQSPPQLEKGLNKIKGHLQKYKEAAGGASGGASGSFDASPKPGAVQTATNPKTGEKLQLVNGQWVPAK